MCTLTLLKPVLSELLPSLARNTRTGFPFTRHGRFLSGLGCRLARALSLEISPAVDERWHACTLDAVQWLLTRRLAL